MAKKSKGLPVLEVNECPPSKPTKDMIERERKYEIEDALRTLQRAEELKKDKTLMRDVKKAAKEQVKALNKI
ncbi:MAG: hypothetical protein AABY22_27975 [Nanoarchaeota archaeon]|mgnify:CR=1 FL=1